MKAETRSAGDERALARRLIMVVVALTVIAPFSIDTFLPSLPHIAREFGASEFYLQQTLSLYLIGFAAMTLVYGPLSDAFGRRRVVLVSLAGYILTSIACALAPTAHALVLARIGQGVAASGGLVVGRAVVRDSFTGAPAQRVMSQVMLIFSIAPAVAPIIGGWLHDVFGWRAVFWFMAALGVLVWLWAALRLPETLTADERHPGHPRAIAIAYWRALRIPAFMLLIFAIALNFSGMFLYIAGSPVLLYRDLGLGAQDFWMLFIPVVAGLMGGAYISGRMAGHYTHAQAVVVAYWIMLSAAVLNLGLNLALPPSPLTVIGPIAVYACGMSLGTPNLSLLAFDLLPRNRGLASALQNFTQTTLAALVAGLLVAVVAGHVTWFATGTLCICALGFACWLVARRLSP
ncbi:MAG TPA: multidrug effflux MFS transporter [Burkholderiales bacterium]|nr:multidrug effflux MFS transporter [Burkholderiales bacterium]